MVRTAKPKLKGKVAASSSALPPSKATGRIRPKTFKKKAKADPEKQKVAAAEAAVTAEASAPAPPPKPAEVSPAATAAAKKKGVATEAAATAEASAPVPTPKPAEVSPAATAAKNKGVGAGNSGGDQKMSRRAKMKEGEKGDRKKVDEKGRIKKGKKDEKAGEGRSAAGFIFMCSAKTKPECFHSGVFGLPMGMISEVEKIRPGAKLFLYDFDLKLLYGIYKAKTKGGLDLVRSAFHGKFPAQVKFKIDKDCLPLPESKFKHAIKENYNSKGKFTQELSSRQVSRLLELFKPVTIPQPTLHYVEERHRSNASEGHVPPGYVEERRLSRYAEEMHHPRLVEERRLPYDHEERRRSLHVEDICHPRFLEESHATTNSLHDPLRSQHVTSLPELHYVPPTYYRHDVPTFDNRYHQPQVDIMYERSVPRPIGEATDRNPLLPRDYRVLPEEIAARSEDVDELYRSYKIATRAMELRQGPSYVTTAYDDPRSAYSESVQRAVSTRANVPGVPVSSLYSFAGAPAYR